MEVSMAEAKLTIIEIDGIVIPVGDDDQVVAPDEDVVTKVFEAMAAIEEAERPSFNLSTSTSHG
jgi:hypothetical protein